MIQSIANRTSDQQASTEVNIDRGSPEYDGYYKFQRENKNLLNQLISQIAPDFVKISDTVSRGQTTYLKFHSQ